MENCLRQRTVAENSDACLIMSVDPRQVISFNRSSVYKRGLLASRNLCAQYNFILNKVKSVHNLLLVYFFLAYFLYIFRATMCPSSGETTVFMRHLLLSGMQSEVKFHFTSLYFTLHMREYQVSHKQLFLLMMGT